MSTTYLTSVKKEFLFACTRQAPLMLRVFSLPIKTIERFQRAELL
jgi:hypothetical protein